jgi:hypothetical protein
MRIYLSTNKLLHTNGKCFNLLLETVSISHASDLLPYFADLVPINGVPVEIISERINI